MAITSEVARERISEAASAAEDATISAELAKSLKEALDGYEVSTNTRTFGATLRDLKALGKRICNGFVGHQASRRRRTHNC